MLKHSLQKHTTSLLFCCLFLYSCTKKQLRSFDYPEHLLQEGDVVFRCGTSMASNMIILSDKGTSYSHIGIIVKQNDIFKVIHAVPDEHDFPEDEDRVKIDDIQTFFNPDRSIAGAVMRIGNDTIATQAAQKAIQILNRNTLFDHDYDLDDSTKMYCTELIHFIYNQLGVDLAEGRRSTIRVPMMSGTYILPSDIYKNSILQNLYSY